MAVRRTAAELLAAKLAEVEALQAKLAESTEVEKKTKAEKLADLQKKLTAKQEAHAAKQAANDEAFKAVESKLITQILEIEAELNADVDITSTDAESYA
jgi:hypothetical protein